MKRITIFLLAFSALMLFATGCAGGGKDKTEPRGRYIYDEADRLPLQSEVSLASYLWRLDSQSGYEIILVFPKDQMDEQAMIKWFNDHGVGKKEVDNGAAVFILPDGLVFVAIGSGNDKVSVTFSKTAGERIFQDFKNDPVLTLLRFTSAIGGKINEGIEREIGSRMFDAVKNNIDIILLWAAVIALLFFLIQQFDGFQKHDLIMPVAVFVVLGAFIGISALTSSVSSGTYKSYGVITSTKTGSYLWTHIHTICTSTGKATTCTSYPHIHTMYTNDVKFISYEFKEHSYRFQTDEYPGAWHHSVGEFDALTLNIEDDSLVHASGIDDNSGGKTIGDGVWILAGKGKK